jgi:hypothetical protein
VYLSACILALFPDAVPGVDFEVVSDESGERIVLWRLAASRPSRAELGAAWLSVLKARKRRELEAAFDAETRRDFPSAYQLVAVFVTDARDARVMALKARLAKLRDLTARVEAAQTEAEIEAIGW